MHAGPELLVGQLELLLEVGQLAVQVGVLMLQLAEEVSGVPGVGHEMAAAASADTDTAARRLPGPGRHGAVRVVVQRGEAAAVAAVPVERPVVAVVAVLAARVGQYAAAAAAARVAVQRLVPGRRHDAHAVHGTAGAAGPVGRAAGRAHGPSPVVQQHGAVEVVVAVVRRGRDAAAAADAQAAASHAGLVRAAGVVVGRTGARPDRPAAHRAVALAAAASDAARARRVRARRRPVDRRQLGGYAPGAAGRARARGAQRRARPVRFPGRHGARVVVTSRRTPH